MTETYTFAKELWADVIHESGNERTQGEAETHDRRARIRLHERETVSATDLFQVNGTWWKVTDPGAVVAFPDEMVREVRVTWVDKSNFTTAES